MLPLNEPAAAETNDPEAAPAATNRASFPNDMLPHYHHKIAPSCKSFICPNLRAPAVGVASLWRFSSYRRSRSNKELACRRLAEQSLSSRRYLVGIAAFRPSEPFGLRPNGSFGGKTGISPGPTER